MTLINVFAGILLVGLEQPIPSKILSSALFILNFLKLSNTNFLSI
jgi:hypothetical protein